MRLHLSLWEMFGNIFKHILCIRLRLQHPLCPISRIRSLWTTSAELLLSSNRSKTNTGTI